MPDLILMWQAALEGWVPPTTVTEPQYESLRHAEPSALRGFVGFPCSFGGKWFGGYARDPKRGRNFADVASRSIQRKASLMRGATVLLADYRDMGEYVGPNTVVYCDPPYASTTGYRGVASFDSDEFWEVMRGWASTGARVFVSEYQAPQDWECVWEGVAKSSLSGKGSSSEVRERLFTKG